MFYSSQHAQILWLFTVSVKTILLGGRKSVGANYVQLIDGVKVTLVLTNFMPVGSVHFMTKGCWSLQLWDLFLQVNLASVLGCLVAGVCTSMIVMSCGVARDSDLLNPDNILCSEVSSVWVHYRYSHFIFIVLAWQSFFYPITLSLYLYIKSDFFEILWEGPLYPFNLVYLGPWLCIYSWIALCLCSAAVYALHLFLFPALPSILFIPVVDLFEFILYVCKHSNGFLSWHHHNVCHYSSFPRISLITPFVVWV